MKLTTDALVIWETKTGEADRVITLLSAKGVLTAYAKGSLRPRNKLTSSTAMLSYSNFELFEGKNMYTVDEAESVKRFMRIACDAENYALAAYFCELIKLLSPVEDDAADYLSLIMNSLYLLDEGRKPCELVKSVFELRVMCLSGYMPELAVCKDCGAGSFDCARFKDGVVVCDKCAAEKGRTVNAPAPVLRAMRHIVFSPANKAFSFELSENARKALSRLCENYVCERLERRPSTLDFYRSIT